MSQCDTPTSPEKRHLCLSLTKEYWTGLIDALECPSGGLCKDDLEIVTKLAEVIGEWPGK